MRTHIIQLDSNEDIISVQDKMNWNQARRILLVWPKDGQPLSRKLDLNLIARHSANIGAQLALVTQESLVQENADILGIPVFTDPRQAQNAQWNDFQRSKAGIRKGIQKSHLQDLRQTTHPNKSSWSEHRAVKLISLVISMLAVLILGVYILPSATISVSPQVEEQTMVFDLVADPNANSINYSTGILPAYTQEVIIEGRDSLTATGSMSIPAQAASGFVRFSNESDHSISIPAGTVITSSSNRTIRFITSSAIESDVAPGELKDLPVQAMKPGLSGNLPAYELDMIDGELELNLTVLNPEDMIGGSEVKAPSPSEADRAILRQRLIDRLMRNALEQLQSVIPDSDFILSSTLSVAKILDETTFPAVGEPGNDLDLSMRIRVKAQVIAGESVHALVIPIMNSYTPAGYDPQDNTLQISQVNNPDIRQDGKTAWTIRATRQLQASIQFSGIASQVSGKSVSQAVQTLISMLPLASQPTIHLEPGWWPWLPIMAMRIQVVQVHLQ